MSIRCAAKAVIICENKVLLNMCSHDNGDIYYDLPGGGQHKYEDMESAVRREVMEETGYAVKNMRFAALAEDIFMEARLREIEPDYCHRIYHIFAANVAEDVKNEPTELDKGMKKSVWVDINEVKCLPEVFPARMAELVDNIVNGGPVMYLGTNFIEKWE